MPKRFAVLLAALSMAATLAVAPSADAGSSDRSLTGTVAAKKATAAQKKYNRAAFLATNAQRKKHNRKKLTHKTCLTKLAKKRAAYLAKTRVLKHQSLKPISKKCGNGWVGENIAYGYGNGKALVKAWMKSPHHRANILNKHFDSVGIFVVKGGGQWWASQVFWGKP